VPFENAPLDARRALLQLSGGCIAVRSQLQIHDLFRSEKVRP